MTSSQDPEAPSTELRPLEGRRILLAVTGSIAAYKSVLLFRLLQKAGAELEVILTESAARFVGASTFRGFGAAVHTDMFSAPGELHVRLGEWADALVIAPATADVIARLRQGRADDLLAATALCRRGLLALAPGMHPRMWLSAAVQENVAALAAQGVQLLGPVRGEVASGDVGLGRMAEPEFIVGELVRRLKASSALANRHLVVTAGPTSEPLDPVRVLTNVSSGTMGFAIAAVAARRGARVTLITGPVARPTPAGVTRVDVTSALEMRDALWARLGSALSLADALVMCAAVSDYRPKEPSSSKLKREGQPLLLELVPNPDLLAEVGAARRGRTPLLVGFALETADDATLIQLARDKLVRKRVDLVVANVAAEALGGPDNRAFLVTADDATPLERQPKEQIAERLLDWLEAQFANNDAPGEVQT